MSKSNKDYRAKKQGRINYIGLVEEGIKDADAGRVIAHEEVRNIWESKRRNYTSANSENNTFSRLPD